MTQQASEGPLLRVSGLEVRFPSPTGDVQAASDVSFELARGRTLGIVGESGSGKTATLRALCGLVPAPGRMTAGVIELDGVAYRSAQELAVLRGRRMAMIFQDPATTLNPLRTIGDQLEETLRIKLGRPRRAASVEAVELLGHVGIPEASRRSRSYPHELSGGLRQRVMIALALATEPDVLLADEPTTALDVTTQEQILDLLAALQRERGMSIVLVTHDLGVVAESCDDVVVLYAGYVVERGEVEAVLERPQHPYTRGLVAAVPTLEPGTLPEAIPGSPPDLSTLPAGCPFIPRCALARPACSGVDMPLESQTWCACPFERRESSPSAVNGATSHTAP